MLTKTTTTRFWCGRQTNLPTLRRPMHLIRRGPHSDFGVSYERQTFLCTKCNVEIERSADKQGQPARLNQ
jgi:hypothetical protein